MITLNEIVNYFKNGLNWEPILIIAGMALVCGIFICLTYHFTHNRKNKGFGFEAGLVATSVIAALTLSCITSQTATIIAIVVIAVGSLFRVALTKEQQDERYYTLWSAAVGICIGETAFLQAAVISVIVFIVLLVCHLIDKKDMALIVVKGVRDREMEVKGILFQEFNKKAKLKGQSSDQDKFEVVYEVTNCELLRKERANVNIIGLIYDVGGIESVQIVTGEDKQKYEE